MVQRSAMDKDSKKTHRLMGGTRLKAARCSGVVSGIAGYRSAAKEKAYLLDRFRHRIYVPRNLRLSDLLGGSLFILLLPHGLFISATTSAASTDAEGEESEV